MSRRTCEKLQVVDYAKGIDKLVRPTPEIESFGRSDSDLCCGQDGTLLLRSFSVEEAQNFFGVIGTRVVAQCQSCGSYNLLAATLEKGDDGVVVTLPRRES